MTIPDAFNNQGGTVSVTAGTLVLNGGTITDSAGSTMNFSTGTQLVTSSSSGTITGSGTGGSITNSGATNSTVTFASGITLTGTLAVGGERNR